MNKEMVLTRLRIHLSQLFDARHQGTLQRNFSANQGFIDGYMSAIEELEPANAHELLDVIAEEREAAARRAEAA